MHTLKTIFENSFIQNFISAIIGGLVVYYIQRKNEIREKKSEKIQNSIVGKKDWKILDQDFLYKYEPGKITIDKIIEEIGKPFRKTNHSNNITSNIFEFKNAKVDIWTDTNTNSIYSITVFSKLDNEFPINCRLSFEDENEDAILGKAKITEVIIRDNLHFETVITQLGYETVIGTFNAYRQTKHLKYFYQIDGKFDSINETKGQIIKQVCVTQLEEIHPFFDFHDTLYG